jgi:tripartite-type tricarboxylate transporter receptor subunit TctC
MKSASRVARIALAAVVIAGVGQVAIAQDYPARPIRLIVPAAPAGAADTLSRMLARKLSEPWGTAE